VGEGERKLETKQWTATSQHRGIEKTLYGK
jgi:hypothetical protein